MAQNNTTQIHHKDDLNFILAATYSGGQPVAWPGYNWLAKLYTVSPLNSVVAYCRDGETSNCFDDDNRIHIVIDSPRLVEGALMCEFTAFIPDSDMPDGIRRVVQTFNTGIVIDKTEIHLDDVKVETILPIIKGEKGDKGDKGDKMTFADLTTDDVTALQRPATEAAARIEEAEAARKKTMSAIEKQCELFAANESDRINNEIRREQHQEEREAIYEAIRSEENRRQLIEKERVEREEDRSTSEWNRIKAEDARVNAAQERSEEYAQIKATFVTVTELDRIANEQHRQENESLRDAAEKHRLEREQIRETGEQMRDAAEKERIKAEDSRKEDWKVMEHYYGIIYDETAKLNSDADELYRYIIDSENGEDARRQAEEERAAKFAEIVAWYEKAKGGET